MLNLGINDPLPIYINILTSLYVPCSYYRILQAFDIQSILKFSFEGFMNLKKDNKKIYYFKNLLVLAHETKGEEHPTAYYSRKMQPRERRYSATEQEGLAVVNACMHFTPYLLGHPFTVVTDHKALVSGTKKPPLLLTPQLDGHLKTVHLLHQVLPRKK